MGLASYTPPNDGVEIRAKHLRDLWTALSAQVNGGLDTDNIEDGGISGAKLANLTVTRGKLETSEQFPVGATIAYPGAAAPTGWLLCQGQAVSRSTYATLFTLLSTTWGAGDGSTTFNLPDLRERVPIGSGAGTLAISFAPTDVAVATNIITVPSNESLYTGAAVVLSTTGAVPAGLVAGTTYYVIYISATTIYLATSRANAVAGTAIDITSQGTGTHTLTLTLTNRTLGAYGGEEAHSQTAAELAAHTHTFAQRIMVWDAGQSGAVAGASPSAQFFGFGSTASMQSGGGSSGAHNNMPPFAVMNYIIKTGNSA